MRIEIETALRRNILVIPVLVGKATMPSAKDLPESMKSFAFRNATPLRVDPDFHRDVDRLTEGIASVVAEVAAKKAKM